MAEVRSRYSPYCVIALIVAATALSRAVFRPEFPFLRSASQTLLQMVAGALIPIGGATAAVVFARRGADEVRRSDGGLIGTQLVSLTRIVAALSVAIFVGTTAFEVVFPYPDPDFEGNTQVVTVPPPPPDPIP